MLSHVLIFFLAVESPSNDIEPTLKPVNALGFMIDLMHISNEFEFIGRLTAAYNVICC